MPLSLQAKVTLQSIIVAIFITLGIGTLSFYELFKNSKEQIKFEAGSQAATISTYINSWSDDRRNAIKAVRQKIESSLNATPSVDEKRILDILQQAQSSLGFGMTFLGLENGAMYRHDPSLNSADYDPRVRSWYKDAKAKKKAYVTTPYISASTNKLSMTFVEPIILNGEFKGAIGGLVFLDTVLNSVLSLDVLGDGYVTLFDNSGNIIAHPNKSLILKKSSELSPALDDGFIRSASSAPLLSDMTIQGKDYSMYTSPIKGTPWILGLIMDKQVLHAPIWALGIKTLIISLIIIVVAALVVMQVTRFLLSDLRRVSDSMAQIAKGDGDLTQRLTSRSKDEIAVLVNNFNQFVAILHQTISHLKGIGQNLAIQATEAHDSSEQSAYKLSQQGDNISMVATAVHQMAQATQEIAGNATSTAHDADNTVSASSVGQSYVEKSQNTILTLASEIQEVSTVIDNLSQNADNINAILTTISGIAEQTNLLALNAAIEAARAGEQGRGFAVVADEVRELSQRTYSSIEEIQKMIEALQSITKEAVAKIQISHKQAGNSVNDINQAKESLDTIQQSITSINERTIQIATATEEQTSVTGEINNSTAKIQKSSEELIQLASESAERAKTLKYLAEDLSQNINNFRT